MSEDGMGPLGNSTVQTGGGRGIHLQRLELSKLDGFFEKK